jgi:hypothetical protein
MHGLLHALLSCSCCVQGLTTDQAIELVSNATLINDLQKGRLKRFVGRKVRSLSSCTLQCCSSLLSHRCFQDLSGPQVP